MIWAALAYAGDDASAWERLYDARLVEAADGTPEVAAKFYEELEAEMSPGDPLYGQTCYWLGRAYYELGQDSLAVRELGKAAQDEAVRPQAQSLLARLELEALRVTALPFAVRFDAGTGPFVRAGETSDKGAIEVRSLDGDAALAWNTRVAAAETDRLSMALEVPRAEHLSFRVRATTFPAELRLVLLDATGATTAAPVLRVPTTEWLLVDVPVRRDLRLVELVDITGVSTDRRGPNILLLDDVEVR